MVPLDENKMDPWCLRSRVDSCTQEVIRSDEENQEEASKDTVGAWYAGIME